MGGPYQFRREDAEAFARSTGIRTFTNGNELFFSKCPYCGEYTNDKKTFSINLTTGMYSCFRSSCGAKGNMLTLARDFGFSLGRNNDEYYYPTRHYKVFKQPTEPIKPKDVALAYLEERGISADIVEKYQITSKENIIVFPHFDEHGAIQTIKYRNPAPQEGQAKEWFERGCKPILFGMAQCDLNASKTLIVTEGQIDALSIAEAGIPNAVSVPGGVKSFTWIPYCWDWMQQWERIVVFGDHEHGKVTLYNDFLDHWKHKVWCVRAEDYKDCKDANDILRKYGAEQLRKCIDHAEKPPLTHIIDMSDVEDVDVNTLEKLHTNLPDLDITLAGGLPFGQLILITGKAGDGKSTLANQLIVEALNQEHKVFVYSGELPNYLLKSWMTFQAAGPDHIDGTTSGTYTVKPYAKKLINEWYKDHIWIYDNRIATDEEIEQFRLMELVEEVIVRNGVRVILLDNLMTAIDLEAVEGQDKYDKQSLFIKKLTRTAMKHNVLIMLVAHKRKMTSSEVNDTVAGSADIVNLASIVISYERSDKKDEQSNGKRWLKVTKNRLFGVTHDGLLLEFDEKSKRIYQSGTSTQAGTLPTWHYGWETLDLETKEEQTELPWEE